MTIQFREWNVKTVNKIIFKIPEFKVFVNAIISKLNFPYTVIK